MPAGRPPKPIEQHLKEGTYRKDRHAGALVLTGSRGIQQLGAPAHLTRLQRAVWDELAGMLDSIVRESDAAMVETCAVAFATYREAQGIIDEEGLIVTEVTYGKDGEVLSEKRKAHPAEQVRNRAMKIFMDTSARLGLSPSDRARLGLNTAAFAKTAAQVLDERYGDDGDVIEGVAEERPTLSDGDLGYNQS